MDMILNYMGELFKNFVKKLPGIKKVVEGRDRYILLYEEARRINEQTENQKKTLELKNEKLKDCNKELQETLQDKDRLLEKQSLEALAAKEQIEKLQSVIEKQKNESEKLAKQLAQLSNGSESSYLTSGVFWNEHYLHNGNSGTGSYNRLAEFKAEIVNKFIVSRKIQSVAEIGCGDGNQLSLIHYPNYVGIDVSEVIIKKDREKFRDFQNYSFFHSLTEREKYIHRSFDMTISMDVIFHLLEDDVFTAYMDDLFNLADKYVVIYSSNHEEYTRWPEYRHRNFTGYVSEHHPEWKLIRYIPNKYPYKIGQEETTSASDFYIYQKRDAKKEKSLEEVIC